MVNAIKEVGKDHCIKVAFCCIINFEDEDFKDKVNDVNNKLKRYCDLTDMDFIGNSNIDGSYLNRAKLHLNIKGTTALAKNLCSFVRYLPLG